MIDDEQLPLYFNSKRPTPPHVPYVTGSDTSLASAAEFVPIAAKAEARVFAVIEKRGARGATDDEVEQVLGMRHQTASSRRRVLVQKGVVIDSGERRPTRSGRTATVWIVAV